jgi:hypothetical protein
MAGPDMGFLNAVNSIVPYTVAIAVLIGMVIFFVWYRQKYMPEIARIMTTAAHSRSLPVFLQDEMGNVVLHLCDKKYPSGLVHVNKKGWFMLPDRANLEKVYTYLMGIPLKDDLTEDQIAKAVEEKLELMTQAERDEFVQAHGILAQTPILRGLNKQVFFGFVDSPSLQTLGAIAHADLPAVQLLSREGFTNARINSLQKEAYSEGADSERKEPMKLLMYVIIISVPIAITGIIAWLLTQGGSASLSLLWV